MTKLEKLRPIETFNPRIDTLEWATSYKKNNDPSGDNGFAIFNQGDQRLIAGAIDGVKPAAGIPESFTLLLPLDTFSSTTLKEIIVEEMIKVPFVTAEHIENYYQWNFITKTNSAYRERCQKAGINFSKDPVYTLPLSTFIVADVYTASDSLLIAGYGDCMAVVLYKDPQNPSKYEALLFSPELYKAQDGLAYNLAADELKNRLKGKLTQEELQIIFETGEFFKVTYETKRLPIPVLLSTQLFPFYLQILELSDPLQKRQLRIPRLSYTAGMLLMTDVSYQNHYIHI